MKKRFLMGLFFLIGSVAPVIKEVCIYNIREEQVSIICQSSHLEFNPIVKQLPCGFQDRFKLNTDEYQNILVCYDDAIQAYVNLENSDNLVGELIVIVPGVNA